MLACELPRRSNEMACVTVWATFKIVLVLRFGLPEIACRGNLCNDLTWPDSCRLDVCDSLLGDHSLFVVNEEDCRPITRSNVISLAIVRSGIVDLKKKFENVAI